MVEQELNSILLNLYKLFYYTMNNAIIILGKKTKNLTQILVGKFYEFNFIL